MCRPCWWTKRTRTPPRVGSGSNSSTGPPPELLLSITTSRNEHISHGTFSMNTQRPSTSSSASLPSGARGYDSPRLSSAATSCVLSGGVWVVDRSYGVVSASCRIVGFSGDWRWASGSACGQALVDWWSPLSLVSEDGGRLRHSDKRLSKMTTYFRLRSRSATTTFLNKKARLCCGHTKLSDSAA